LARVRPLQGRSRGFESHHLHHILPGHCIATAVISRVLQSWRTSGRESAANRFVQPTDRERWVLFILAGESQLAVMENEGRASRSISTGRLLLVLQGANERAFTASRLGHTRARVRFHLHGLGADLHPRVSRDAIFALPRRGNDLARIWCHHGRQPPLAPPPAPLTTLEYRPPCPRVPGQLLGPRQRAPARRWPGASGPAGSERPSPPDQTRPNRSRPVSTVPPAIR
jgi:hypothetical protein